MKISELTTGQGNVDVEGTLSEVGEPKVFTKFGRELKVSNAILKDDSGNIKLTLWNEDVSKFNEGDVVKITNGYVNEFQGEPQLTAGKFGKMEKVGEGEVSEESSSEDLGETKLSDETAETMAEDVAEDGAVGEAVKEEAPEETSEEQIEEASEELEEAAEESEEPEESEEAEEPEESEEAEEPEAEESQEDF